MINAGTLLGLTTRKKMAIAKRWVIKIANPRPSVVSLPKIGYSGAARVAVKEVITPKTEAAVPASDPWACRAMVCSGVTDTPKETI